MANISYDFSGQVAVVTGGANGIGAEVALHYHRAGAKVVIWDLQEPAELEFPHLYCHVDISSMEMIDAAIERTVAEFGRIDILSHNAGFAGLTQPVTETCEAAWQRVVDINLVGTYRLCRAVVPVMQRNGYGRIINMASLAGKEGTPNASAYSAAKGGGIAFTKSLAKEIAETDIRVNCIAPAAVRTAILDQMTPEFVQIMIDKSPMKRLGEVDEVAELVVWLSSRACSFSTGAVFDLSGGRSVY